MSGSLLKIILSAGITANDFIWLGGYQGPADQIADENRWMLNGISTFFTQQPITLKTAIIYNFRMSFFTGFKGYRYRIDSGWPTLKIDRLTASCPGSNFG